MTLKHTPDLVKHLLNVCLFLIFATFGETTVVDAATKSSDLLLNTLTMTNLWDIVARCTHSFSVLSLTVTIQ